MKKRILTILLAFVVTLSFIPFVGNNSVAFAEYNYDGFLAKVNYIKTAQPEGKTWTNNTTYPTGWGGCWAFANYCAEQVFGSNTPRNNWIQTNINSVVPGDIISTDRWNGSGWTYGHTMFVIGDFGSYVSVAEGNYNGKVHYDRHVNKNSDSFIVYHAPNYDSVIPQKDTTEHNPRITVDEVKSNSTGTVSVRGWAFDPDDTGAQLPIHVYASANGNSYFLGVITANTDRPDVNRAFGCGDYHGFEATLFSPVSGNVTIAIAAINAGVGNTSWGNESIVTIPKDSINPTISNVTITNISSAGYTVSCNVSDNVGVKEVLFPTWTSQDGQDDIQWYQASVSGGEATYTVKTSNHSRQADCKYITHIYVGDYMGNTAKYEKGEIIVPSPISNVQVSDINASGYTITCAIDTAWGEKGIVYPTWTVKNGQDDVTWHTGNISGGRSTYRVQTKDHGNALCEEYATHIYVDDGNGISSKPVEIYVTPHSFTYVAAKDATVTTEGQIEHWVCNNCGKVFKDSTGKTEITKAQTVIPKLTPSTQGAQENEITDLAAVKLSKPRAAKKATTVKWKKISKKNLKKIKKVQVQVSLDPNFNSGVVTKNVSAKKTSIKIKTLASKKKYYVRVRAYTYSGGVVHVSKWSARKAVKIK